MVNFTFVTHKGARPEKSELVKSHVMRESQRRRREARQKRHQNNTTSSQPSALPGASQCEEHPQASSQLQSSLPYHPISSSVPSVNLTVGHSNPANNIDPSLLPWASSGSVINPSSPTSNAPTNAHGVASGIHETAFSNQNQQLSRNWSSEHGMSLELVNLYSAFGQLSSTNFDSKDPERPFYDPSFILTRQPRLLYAAFRSENDPSDASWMSQSLFDRVNELTAHYTASLYIELPGLPATNPVAYWQRQALVNSKILLSTALFYCAYRDTVRGMTGDDHHFFHDRILHLINLALGDPETAVSDDNLAAVISMCMYENVRGGELIDTHLRGLRQMLDMRGGINNIRSVEGQYISEMSILQDMMRATCSNVSPMMFDITGPILRDVQFNHLDNWYPQSPLRVLNDAGFARPIPELQSSFETLKDAFDAFEMLCIEAFDPDTAAEEAAPFKGRRDKFWTHLEKRLPANGDEISSTAKGRVEEAIHLAARIHFRAVAFRIQHNDVVNIKDMKRLYTVIRKLDLGYWKVAHYVYLWILLTGGAASSNQPEYRPHFVSEILRLGLSIGLFDWRSFRQILGNFLWLQQFLRRNGLESTPELSEETA